MMQSKKLKLPLRSILCLFLLVAVSAPACFAQDKELESYQQQMMQALSTGNFPVQAHAILDKLQDTELYETLLLRVLAVPSLKQDQKLAVLKELLLLYELLERWEDLPGIYRQLLTIDPENTDFALEFSVSLLASGEAEKAATALDQINSDEPIVREYKSLLLLWIQYSIDPKKINEQQVLALANSNNAVVRISSLQLLILVTSAASQEKYADLLKTYTNLDFPFFSTVQRYMLSLSLVLAKSPLPVNGAETEQKVPTEAGSGTITIQAGAFAKFDNASKLKAQIEKLGYTVKIVQRQADNIYLVLVYSDSADYQSIILKLKDQGIEAWLVSD